MSNGITQAKLKAWIEADDSQFRTVQARTESSLKGMASTAQQSTATVGTAFAGIGPKIQNALGGLSSTINNSVGSIGKTAQSSFQQINTAADQAFAKLGFGFDQTVLQVNGSLGKIPAASNAAFSSLAEAATRVSPAFNSIGIAAQTASNSIASSSASASNALKTISGGADVSAKSIADASGKANASLQSIAGGAASAGNSVSALSARFAENKAEIARYDGEIAIARSELAQLSQRIVDASAKFGPYSNQVKDLRVQYAQLSAATRGLVADKGLLAQENRALSASMAQANTVVTQASTTTAASAKAADVAREGFNRLTSQIRTNGTIFEGYDGILQAAIGSIGGVTVGTSILISMAGALLPKILGLSSAKKEQVEVSQALIESDLALVSVFERLSSGSRGADRAVQAQTETFRRFLALDVQSLLLSIADKFTAVEVKTKAAEQASAEYERLLKQQADTTKILSGEMDRQGQRLDRVLLQNEAATVSIENQRKAIQTATIARTEGEQALTKEVDTLIKYGQATNKTGAELIELARAAKLSEGAIARLSAEIAASTNAQDLFNAALRNFEAPSISIEGTSGIIGKLRDDLVKAIGELKQPAGSIGDIFAGIRPKVQALNDNLKEFAQVHGKNAADTLRLYRAEISKLPPDIQAAIRLLDQAGKNAEAFSTKVKKAKDELDKNSPFITERVLAGNPGAIESVMSKIGERIANSFKLDSGGLKGLSQQFIKSIASGFEDKGELEKSLTGSAAKWVDAFGKQIDSGLSLVESIIKQVAPEVQAATDEMMRRSFVDKVREHLGITEALWRKFTASQKDLVNKAISFAADDYVLAMGQIRAVTEKELEKSRTIWKRFADGVADEDVQQIRVSMFELTFSIAGMAKAIENSNLLKLEVDLEKLSKGAVSASDAIKGTVESITGDLESMLPPVERVAAGVRDGVKQFVDDLIRMSESLGLTGADLERFVQEHLGRLPEHLKKTGEEMVQVWKNELIKLPGALDDVFNKVFSKFKGAASGILDIIGNLPSSIAGKLQSATNVFLQWVDRIDGILKGLHKIFDSIPDGLGGLIKSVVDLFRGTSKAVTDAVTSTSQGAAKAVENAKAAMSGTGSSVESAAGVVASGTGRMLASLTSLASGFLAFAGIGGQGAAGGAISGALGAVSALGGIAAIFKASFAPLLASPWGIAAIAGGAILGAIFGRKSAAQKEAEARQAEQQKLQIEKLKQDIARTAADVQSVMMDVFNKGFDFLSKLPDYTRVPKQAAQAFRADMIGLAKLFIDIFKMFPGQLLDGAKKLGEALGPAVDMANAAIDLLGKIGIRTPVTQAAILQAGVELEILAGMLGEIAERVPNKIEKAAKKMGTRLAPAIALFSDSIAGLKDAFDLKALPVGVLDIWASSVEAIIAKTGSMAEKFDKLWTKQMAFFAERAGAAMGFFSSGVEAIKSAIEVPRLSTATVEAIFTDLTQLMNRAFDFSKAIPTDLLNLGASVAEKVLPWLNIIKTLSEAFTPLKDYASVKDALAILMSDFQESLSMMRFLDDLSIQFKDRAVSIETNLLAAVKSMANGMGEFGKALAALNGTMQGGLSSFTHIVNPEATGGGINFGALSFAAGGGSNFSALTPAPAFIPSSPSSFARATSSSTTTTNITHIENFNVTPPAGLTDAQMRAYIEQQERIARQRANAKGRRGDEL